MNKFYIDTRRSYDTEIRLKVTEGLGQMMHGYLHTEHSLTHVITGVAAKAKKYGFRCAVHGSAIQVYVPTERPAQHLRHQRAGGMRALPAVVVTRRNVLQAVAAYLTPYDVV